MTEKNILKEHIREIKDNLKKEVTSLSELEETAAIMAKTLRMYEELIDISTLVQKEKLIQYKLNRLLKRMVFDKGRTILGIRIEFNFGNYRDLKDIIVNYIDSHIRPTDTLFLFEDGSLGIIYVLNKNIESKVKVLTRIEEILSNFEIQLDYKVKSNIKWELSSTELDTNDTIENFFVRLKEGRE